MSYPCRYTHHSLCFSAQLVYLAACQAAIRTVGSLLTSLTNGLLFRERGRQLFGVMIYVVFLSSMTVAIYPTGVPRILDSTYCSDRLEMTCLCSPNNENRSIENAISVVN